MKIKTLFFCTTVTLISIGFSACKKDTSTTTGDDVETTFELSSNDAISESMADDATGVLMETGINNDFAGRNSGPSSLQTMNNLSCATVTVTPQQGFPKNISIDFGAGCTSANGITRKGKIIVVVSDSLRKAGSVSIMNFDNYYVDNYKIEGTITWTNTSVNTIKSWERKCENGKITTSDGRYWLHNGIKDIIQVQGSGTPFNLLDDVYSITGQHTVTNAKGKTATSTIIAPLELKVSCENVDKGTIQIAAPNHTALLDFGDGTCDRTATITVDGKTPRTILLR